MLYNPSIHSFSHLVKSLLGRIETISDGINYPTNELLVLNYHSTPKKFIPHFKKQVRWMSENFNIISPAELEAYYNGTYTSKKCSLLFTFDDGLANNRYAAEVLNEFKMKALFFVIPGFIDCGATQQKAFYLKNIRPIINSAIDHRPEDFSALSWEELQTLTKDGHMIGSHTLNHTLLANSSSAENSEKEIVHSKQVIENKISVPVNSFCSINNTLESVGKKEKEIIEKNYSFHFTTLPGYNAIEKNKLFIKRRNVECFWTMGSIFYAIGKSDLKRWQQKIDAYLNI